MTPDQAPQSFEEWLATQPSLAVHTAALRTGWQAAIASQQTEIANLTSSLRDRRAMHDRTRVQLAEAKVEIEQKQLTIDDLRRQLRELEAEIERLKNSPETLFNKHARYEAVIEAARELDSPCDHTEDARGYCIGHGGIVRLPCPIADLRAALAALDQEKPR